MMQGVKRKRSTKRLKHTENVFFNLLFGYSTANFLLLSREVNHMMLITALFKFEIKVTGSLMRLGP